MANSSKKVEGVWIMPTDTCAQDVISDTRAIAQLQQRFDPDGKKVYYAFAIDGEYRVPTDSRANTEHYDGFQVMRLSKHRYKPAKLWSALA